MTRAERFDRRLEAGLEEVALPSFPDYFDDILAVTSRTRQRPAWVFPERWIPMVELAGRPAFARSVPWRPVVLVAALLLALAAVAVVLVGSPAPDLVPTLGVARNGELTRLTGGRLRIGERLLVNGGARAAVFSPDGGSIAYLRDAAGRSERQLVVIDAATGAERVAMPGSFPADNLAISWSPDSSRIALDTGTATGNGMHAATVQIVDLRDGSVRALDPGFPIGEAAWRPGTRDELVVRGWRDERAALFLIRADGSDVRRIVVAADDLDDLGQPAWSPDGTRLAYVYGDRLVAGGEELARLHLVAPDGSGDVVPTDPPGVNDYWPVWSPDGSRIALSQFSGERRWIAIQSMAGPRISPESTNPIGGDLYRVVWAPDGTQALVWLADSAGHLHRLDLQTARHSIYSIGWDALPSWQRLPPG